MIPKIIHYCWFGKKPLPPLAIRCINSWKKYCPEYEIIEWNEDNYDIANTCEFVKKAYEKEKWAFVSDYVRLDVVYRFGGVYLDIDVELLKSLNELIADGRGYFGCEQIGSVATGLGYACEKGELLLKEMMEYYQNLEFSVEQLSNIACPIINTKILKRYGYCDSNNELQIINGIKILPTEYLCPENIWTGEMKYTENTVSIHHYNASWQSYLSRFRMKLIIRIKKILPKVIVKYIRNIFKIRNVFGDETNGETAGK